MSNIESDIEIIVKRIMGKGVCPAGYKPGDRFIYHYDKIDFCTWAFHSMLPFLAVMRFGGKFPWGNKDGSIQICCPDPENPVVFEIKVKEKKDGKDKNNK